MFLPFHPFRPSPWLLLLAPLLLTGVHAAEPIKLVFQNGRSIPLSAVSVQGESMTVTTPAEGFAAAQVFPLAAIDHVYGDKPSEINAATALLLMDKPGEALKLIESVLISQRPTAKIDGNYWMEAAQVALVAYAVESNVAKCTEMGKEISDATPEPGLDPFVALGKAILLPKIPAKDRELVLSDLMSSSMPANVSAYAAIFKAKSYTNTKKVDEALEAFLAVPCIYPSSGLILNAVAELNAAEILNAKSRRQEAVALLTSSVQHSAGTMIATEANKRLESIK